MVNFRQNEREPAANVVVGHEPEGGQIVDRLLAQGLLRNPELLSHPSLHGGGTKRQWSTICNSRTFLPSASSACDTHRPPSHIESDGQFPIRRDGLQSKQAKCDPGAPASLHDFLL